MSLAPPGSSAAPPRRHPRLGAWSIQCLLASHTLPTYYPNMGGFADTTSRPSKRPEVHGADPAQRQIDRWTNEGGALAPDPWTEGDSSETESSASTNQR